MKEVTWDDIRKGDLLVIEQVLPRKGPRMAYNITWAGEVIEHEPRWTKLKQGSHTMTVLQKYGEETITRYMKKDFKNYLKENA